LLDEMFLSIGPEEMVLISLLKRLKCDEGFIRGYVIINKYIYILLACVNVY
jgi:hypothetical protein